MLHIKTPYLYKRGSTYYYARRVPSDLLGCYSTNKIVISLRTRIKRAALLSASHLSLELDGYWSSIRIKKIANKYVRSDTVNLTSNSGIDIKEAKAYYLELKRGLATSSVRRVFSSVKSIVNLAIKERGLSIVNPFLGVYIPDLDDTKERKPVPLKDIRIIQAKFPLLYSPV